jgi:hypothetical protein
LWDNVRGGCPDVGLQSGTDPIFTRLNIALKVAQREISDAIDRVQWTAQGDDQEAASETRKRARQVGPDVIAFLTHTVKSDSFASPAQRVRSAVALLEVGGFIATAPREPTNLFDPEGAPKA